MPTEPDLSAEVTARIDPRELADGVEEAAHQGAGETTEHRPVGSWVSLRPGEPADPPPDTAPTRPWWRFWGQ